MAIPTFAGTSTLTADTDSPYHPPAHVALQNQYFQHCPMHGCKGLPYLRIRAD